ncbi:MAG: hypothetical protein HYT79_04955 [Elusimicrobia bacterium]|nr:hypothetical protein [Elusimicrobiota bacterium]
MTVVIASVVDMVKAKKIRTAVWDDLIRANASRMMWDNVKNGDIKFLRVYSVVGAILPLAFFCDAALALSRVYDLDNRDGTASLKKLVECVPRAQLVNFGTHLKTIRAHNKVLGILRNKYLAHRDVSSWKTRVSSDNMLRLIKDAEDIYADAARQLWPTEHWVSVTEAIGLDHIGYFAEYLKKWDYTPIKERRWNGA